MQNPLEINPLEHIKALRKHLGDIQRINTSPRREPRDTMVLHNAEAQVERELMALEMWAASQIHD